MAGEVPEDALSSVSVEELECKICYRLYNLGARRPKVLECCHRLCAKCLSKMAGLVEVLPHTVACPFCRYPTHLTGEVAAGLPDDHNIVRAVALRGRGQRKRDSNSAELLLSPGDLGSTVSASSSTSFYSVSSPTSPHGTSNCTVITVVGATEERSDHLYSSQAGAADNRFVGPSPWKVWRLVIRSWWFLAQVLVGLLGLLYFSSLPLGIFLLIKRKTTLGIVLVSLVPSSLLMLVVYDVCRWCFR